MDEHAPLMPPQATPPSPQHFAVDTHDDEQHHDGFVDWRHPFASAGMFFGTVDNHTFGSFAEMRGSMLESCCPGDGVLSGALSLITTAATPSMLALPLAFVVGGWTFACASMVFCVVISYVSVRVLALASVSANTDDYENVAGFFLGHKGRLTLRSVLFLYNLGGAVVYLSFIKDSVTPVLVGQATFLPHWLRSETGGSLVLLLAMLVITPLTFYSRLASLRTKGFISNCITIFIIAAITYRYFVPATAMTTTTTTSATTTTTAVTRHGTRHTAHATATRASPPPPLLSPSPLDVLFATLPRFLTRTPPLMRLLPYFFVGPIFLFSYEVQSNVMAVIKDLHDRTGQQVLLSMTMALLVISAFYGVLGVVGSLTFPQLAVGNILAVYPSGQDLLMTTCQLLCCFSAAISYVFCIFPCRQAAYNMLAADAQRSSKIPHGTRVRLGVALSVLCTILAVWLPDVAVVMSLLGALFSATVSMTFPGMFALCMQRAHTYLTGPVDHYLAWALIVTGIAFSVIGTLMSVVLIL